MHDLIITAGSDEARKEIELLIESAIREGVIGGNTYYEWNAKNSWFKVSLETRYEINLLANYIYLWTRAKDRNAMKFYDRHNVKDELLRSAINNVFVTNKLLKDWK